MKIVGTIALIGAAVSLLSIRCFANGITVIGSDYQFRATALSEDKSTLVGEGLVLPLGASEQGMIFNTPGLHYMPNPGPFQYSIPTGVSGEGSTIVGFNMDSDDNRSAWRWTSSGGYASIGPAATTAQSTFATGISADGKTAVGLSNIGSSYTPFVWTSASGTVQIPVAANGYTLVSADGSTVAGGQAFTAPYIWTAIGGVQNLNTLSGSINIVPTAISADGSQVFGEAQDASGKWVLFRIAGGTMTSLGAPSFYDQSTAGLYLAGATADGSELVGRQISQPVGNNPPQSTPWVWTQTGGFDSLTDVLSRAGIDLGTYQIRDIVGISGDGSEIYGTGSVDGIQPSSWIAVVPEPSMAALVTGVLTPMLLGRSKFRSRCHR